jgi:hypothetical protein
MDAVIAKSEATRRDPLFEQLKYEIVSLRSQQRLMTLYSASIAGLHDSRMSLFLLMSRKSPAGIA